MDYYKENMIDIDLETGSIHRSFLNHTVGEGDAEANRYGFRVFRNREPVSLAMAAVIGHFIRADGNTIELTGETDGNTAWVTLEESCYAVEGQYTLAIKLTSGSVVGTIRMVDGTVVNTTDGAVIDPGNVIPDLEDYLAAVEAAEDAAEMIGGYSVTASLINGTDYEIIVTTGGGS